MLSRLFSSLTLSGSLLQPRITTSPLLRTSRMWLQPSSISRLHANTFGKPRYASFPPRYSRQSAQYQGFGRSGFRYRWQNSPPFRQIVYLGGGGTVCFVGYNMERAPVTGRWRFNWVPESYDEQMAEDSYRQTLQQFRDSLLPDWAPEVQRVKRVLERLVPHSGISQDKPWTVHVIQAEEPNAFVLPGGHVFVFSGILPITSGGERGDDGLATVLGHEIAHNVARHSAENLSRNSIMVLGAFLLSLFTDFSNQLTFYVLDLAYNRPGSRAQETEADYIGLMMMAEACYDPRKAIDFWQRMEQAQKVKVPAFLSTHPSDHQRIARIKEWMDQAMEKREEGDCGATAQLANDFQSLSGLLSFR